MLKLDITIGGKSYEVVATDRRLLCLLLSFDERFLEVVQGAVEKRSEIGELLNPRTLTDDRRLVEIDRWLESQGIPKLSEEGSLAEVVGLLEKIMLAIAGNK